MTHLIARWSELRARIGRGGMGAVWRARDRGLRRDVAVKLLHAWIAGDAELRRPHRLAGGRAPLGGLRGRRSPAPKADRG